MKNSTLFALLVAVALVAAPAGAQLFVGTGGFGGAAANDAFDVDVMTGTPTMLFGGQAVWGATNDFANSRVLFTTSGGATDGADLWEWPHAGGAPSLVCTITNVTGGGLRIDGLAIVDSRFYGVHQFDAGADLAGIYEIDMGTCAASSVVPLPSGNVSGIDGYAGLIYGVDDTNTSLISIDPVGGTTATVAAYPGGEADIDGLAVSPAGVAYLVTDEAGVIYPYDLTTDTYLATITSPFASADTFSAGAYISNVPVELMGFSVE